MKRLNDSFKNLAFPHFEKKELMKCIEELVKLDREWLPKKPMHSLYLRPTGMSMENSLGVKPAGAVKLFTIISPVGPYYPAGFKPVKIFCSTESVRAWHGGSGDKKMGANYGPTIYPAQKV